MRTKEEHVVNAEGRRTHPRSGKQALARAFSRVACMLMQVHRLAAKERMAVPLTERAGYSQGCRRELQQPDAANVAYESTSALRGALGGNHRA